MTIHRLIGNRACVERKRGKTSGDLAFGQDDNAWDVDGLTLPGMDESPAFTGTDDVAAGCVSAAEVGNVS